MANVGENENRIEHPGEGEDSSAHLDPPPLDQPPPENARRRSSEPPSEQEPNPIRAEPPVLGTPPQR